MVKKTTAMAGIMVLLLVVGIVSISGCTGFDTNGPTPVPPTSSTGVKPATAEVSTDTSGHSMEQKNLLDRYAWESDMNAINYLYIFNQMGAVCMKFIVKGKVTSSSKRLTPSTVAAGYVSKGDYSPVSYGMPYTYKDAQGYYHTEYTTEVPQDDGTYGASSPYIFFETVDGVYHQQSLDGMGYHLSSQPLKIDTAGHLTMEVEN